ncbi:MAG: flippase-like domain-containing protein [Candidatus Methanoperedens sp.]|nr:flippase-like domain-containing protein [Candidatus Methanoperedens sp.]
MNREKIKARNIWLVILVGAVIFAIFIAEIGYGRFFHLISNVNKSLIPFIILLNILNSITFTISWKFLIPMDVSFYKLFRFYIAGTFINNITPAFGAGGEPIKAILLGEETATSKAECFAGVVSQRLMSIFPFLLIEFMGVGLLLYMPELALGRWEVLALVFSIIFGVGTFVLLAYFYSRKDRLFSFVNFTLRFFAPLIRLVKRGFDHRTHADALESSINSFHGGLKNIRSNKKGLASAMFFSSLGWIFDIMTVYVVFISLGSGTQIHASILIITYIISTVSGWLPLFLPGGLGIVDSTMVALFILNGVPLEIALLATLLYRLASYWFNTILGAFYLLRSMKSV